MLDVCIRCSGSGIDPSGMDDVSDIGPSAPS